MATIEAYEVAQGKRYMVRYRQPNGKQTKKRGIRTKRDAEAFAATVEVSKLKGEFVRASDGRTTVGELHAPWWESKAQLKPSWRERLARPCGASVGQAAGLHHYPPRGPEVGKRPRGGALP